MEEKKEQFGLIYDQYVEKIYRFVYLKVGFSQEIAEDITSRVFTKGWELHRGGGKIENPSAFLYRIARNMIIDHYRGKDKMKTISSEGFPHIADPGTNPYEKAVLASDAEQVKSAIQKIKKDYQDVVIWRYLEDMPISEISAILQKPEGAVRVMIHRGLNALRDVLIEEA